MNFESYFDFDIRFMVETKVVGCSWIELSPGTKTKHENEKSLKVAADSKLMWVIKHLLLMSLKVNGPMWYRSEHSALTLNALISSFKLETW